jgi:hypothetical protein
MAQHEINAHRLKVAGVVGSMGVVKDTRYVRCFWPRLDQPTALFAEGSSGIEVEGPPTPRNVIFPPDTVFLGNTYGNCFFLRDKVPGERPGKPDEYIAVLERADAEKVAKGKLTQRQMQDLRAKLTFERSG